ncbi:hypothetical protein SEVIR_9G356302v4 [Setaria viridis]
MGDATAKFTVFKADLVSSRWLELRSVGDDIALFVGWWCTLARRVSQYELPRNRIHFLDDDAFPRGCPDRFGSYDMRDDGCAEAGRVPRRLHRGHLRPRALRQGRPLLAGDLLVVAQRARPVAVVRRPGVLRQQALRHHRRRGPPRLGRRRRRRHRRAVRLPRRARHRRALPAHHRRGPLPRPVRARRRRAAHGTAAVPARRGRPVAVHGVPRGPRVVPVGGDEQPGPRRGAVRRAAVLAGRAGAPPARRPAGMCETTARACGSWSRAGGRTTMPPCTTCSTGRSATSCHARHRMMGQHWQRGSFPTAVMAICHARSPEANL